MPADPSRRLASSASFAFRLYRVIKSGCRGFACAGVEAVDAAAEAETGSGGWNDCGGYTNNPLALGF